MSPIIDPQVKKDIEARYYYGSTGIREILRNKGELKPISDELLTLYITGAIISAVRAHLSKEVNLKSEDFQTFIEMIWNGITR